jgi:alkylated DNA repair dioxygenase AlkB
MVTPGGHIMSVAMTNCGSAGWVMLKDGEHPTLGRQRLNLIFRKAL